MDFSLAWCSKKNFRYDKTYESPRNLIPDRMYDDLDDLPLPKSTKTTNSNSTSNSNSLDNKKTDNISMFNDGYYTHGLSFFLFFFRYLIILN